MPMPLPSQHIALTKLLEKDEPKVVVVIGTGVSAGATSALHTSWLGLLKHGIEHLVATEVFTDNHGKELSASLDAAFSPFDLQRALQYAELVEQNLKTPNTAAFGRWLEAAFRDFKVRSGKSETLEALRDLQQAGALLLTTNYDSLLSETTGLLPVTWEQHADFFQVIRRQQPGILHIHGHWQRPSSVVLGKSSYERIARDQDFQDLFKSLWLEWSWLYVGCGDGLDDPNLGRLLEWGKRWNKDTPPDYFLAKAEKALALANRPDKPANLISVSYPDHQDLPSVLHSLTPAARCWPFIPVDADFALFRSPASPLSIPFPSRQEYLDGEVPALTADAEVRRRLEKHRWALVLDVASVGKTTLALRMATAPEQRNHPTFYLDLAIVDADDADADANAAMRRLSRPTSLLILDNVHHQPELARQLWDQWRDRPRDSKLLLVATRMQRTVTTGPAQDLGFFEHHATNPAVEVRPTPDDLGAIVKHLYRRVSGPQATPFPIPPPSTLQDWHRDYGSALGAFCLAALGRLAEFHRGHWELPLESASDWIREKWLKRLDAENRENVLCLAVFGAQELEMQVSNEALPYPGKTDQLLRLGLVAKTERGRFGQYHGFNLREPSWGRLILAAQVPAVDEEKVLFETAARHPTAALILSSRLRRERLFERLERLWAYLAITSHNLIKLIPDRPLTYVLNLSQAAKDGKQPLLANQFWEAIEEQPKLAERAWETPLGDVASFLDTAKQHGRNTTPLWEAIEREPDMLAERAWETPLHLVASFLDTAKRHERDTAALWTALERDPNKLAERAWETPLHLVASFLDTAKRHGRNTTPLWEAIEREPDMLAERAWETPLGDVASFLDTAKRHERDTAALWTALERDPNKLAERAWETPLHLVASFLDTAKRHERDTAPLLKILESKPEKLSALAKQTSVGNLAGFCHYAPDTLVMIALADFQATQWDEIPISEPLVGATRVAARCGKVGREDLKSALITILLRRANPQDFPPQVTSLPNVAWLLTHTPAAATALVPVFLEALCTKRWLGGQFTIATRHSLATGLRMLALNQPPEVCRRFQNPSLNIRLHNELLRFAQAIQEEQSEIIQLLGSATLFGLSLKRDWFDDVPVSAIVSLPSDPLPHRADMNKVESWQFQLWLGLRAVTEVTGKPLAVPSAVIARTLDLWRSNLAETSIDAESAEHRVNQSMVTWLESCSRGNQGLVPPAA